MLCSAYAKFSQTFFANHIRDISLGDRDISHANETRANEAQAIKVHIIVVLVIVVLADNANQGIVLVSDSLGDGMSPRTNLYWGALHGLKK